MKKLLLLMTIAALATLVVSCGPPPTGYYPTTTPTVVAPNPTDAPKPTDTPSPTNTPSPTVKPKDTPAPIPPTPQVVDNPCPPPISRIKPSAQAIAEVKPGEATHMNVSRFLPPDVAAPGGANESNYLVTLAEGVKWVKVHYDGSGYNYPESMTKADKDCQLATETLGRGENWPESMANIPSGILVFHHPFGVVDQNSYPDLIYRVEWEDAQGTHVWPEQIVQQPIPGPAGAQPTAQPVLTKGDLGGGKPKVVSMKPGFYYIFNVSCEGCVAGEENVYLVKYTGTGAKVEVPDGSARYFSTGYSLDLVIAEASADPRDHHPAFLPAWLLIDDVTMISF